ncbi:hypothetical protein [Variovorax sp. KK3]|uniref:hypothetical protein n=1 Tax=Variovorax sp. KK3 TaxID=1855728 RepID=UPI00097C03A6|nr:hypothetical protein [Variovorax sp. KK3]
MPITTAQAPQGATDAAHRGFDALHRAQATVTVASKSGGGVASLHEPLAVYSLSGAESAAAMTIAQARQTGWRYLIGQGAAIRSIEIVGDEVTAITQGQVAANLAHALAVASDAVDAAKRYEARVLEFGRAGNSVLWLHADDGSDRFFSLGAEARELEVGPTLEQASRKAQARRSLSAPANATPEALRADEDESGG